MRIPFITARREWKEYERQTMARVEENMRDIEAAEAGRERREAEADDAAQDRAAQEVARDQYIHALSREYPEISEPERQQAAYDAEVLERGPLDHYPEYEGPGYTEPPADWPGWHQDHDPAWTFRDWAAGRGFSDAEIDDVEREADPESDGLDGLAGIAAERAFAHLSPGTPEHDADVDPDIEAAADLADADVAREARDRYVTSQPGSDEHKAAYVDMHREAGSEGFPDTDPDRSYLIDHGYETDADRLRPADPEAGSGPMAGVRDGEPELPGPEPGPDSARWNAEQAAEVNLHWFEPLPGEPGYQQPGERPSGWTAGGEPEYDADGNPAADSDADAGQYEHDPERDPEAGPGRWDFPPPPSSWESDAKYAEWDQARTAALHGTTEADRQLAERYLDEYYRVERDVQPPRVDRAEAARDGGGDHTPVHESGGWLARDGDTVREVGADGTPGREASPDDGRPVAEAAQPERAEDREARAPYPDHGRMVTDQDGRRLAAIGVTAPDGERFTTWSATEQGARVAWPEAKGYTHELISDREAEVG